MLPEGSDAGCDAPLSPLEQLAGPGGAGPYSRGAIVPQAQVDEVLRGYAAAPYASGFYVDRDFSADNLRSQYTRSMIRLGVPLKGYDNVDTDFMEQAGKQFDEFLDPIISEMMDDFGMRGNFFRGAYVADVTLPDNDDVQVWWFSYIVQDREFQRITYADFAWAVFSILAVWFYIFFHTKSEPPRAPPSAPPRAPAAAAGTPGAVLH